MDRLQRHEIMSTRLNDAGAGSNKERAGWRVPSVDGRLTALKRPVAGQQTDEAIAFVVDNVCIGGYMGHDLMTIQTQLKALRGVQRASRLDSPHAAAKIYLQTTRPLIHKVTADAGRLSPVSSDMTSSTRGEEVEYICSCSSRGRISATSSAMEQGGWSKLPSTECTHW